MSYRILTDNDIAQVSMSAAVECMEAAFRQHAAGQLVAPGRLESDLGIGRLVFTTGASSASPGTIGFRCYDVSQLSSRQRSELTAVFDAHDGHLKGLVVGPLLGALRTGAIGGLAVKYMARADTNCLGLVGSGFQARTQLAAALAVRDFQTVKVFSRDAESRSLFAEEMSFRLNSRVQAVESAQAAVEDADVVLCTTTSPRPVIQADWLKPGVHINNVGPKFKDRHELGVDVLARASQVVTDAPAQVEEYGERLLLHGTPLAPRLETLSSLVVGQGALADARQQPEVTLFVSLGLAGTEVVLAERLFELS